MNPVIIKKFFPKEWKLILLSLCPACGKTIQGFRDEISAKEFKISGMCQKCQDKTFN